jgi:nickel-dependent lactate racemase
MNKINLKKNVWYSNDDFTLAFPDDWSVNVHGNQEIPTLSDHEIQMRLDNPIGCESFPRSIKPNQSAIILIDDITRPTPTYPIINHIIDRLIIGGIKETDNKILISGGTHKKATNDEVRLKLGNTIPSQVRILNHDCKDDCVFLGTTTLGTPVNINKHVMESDLKIAISSVYPHPIAGFSGGSKILALGAGGIDTIRILHDLRGGAIHRTGEIDHPFRREINEIAKIAGLNFCVNLSLNQNRMISGVFAGEPEQSFSEAVSFVKKNYSVPVDADADIVIADMYPFDMDFQFAFDRGLWPFEYASKKSTKIILANCQNGIGGHELFPVSNPMMARIIRRLEYFHLRDLSKIGQRVRSIRNILWRRKLSVTVVSPFITKDSLIRVLPRGDVLTDWEQTLTMLTQKYSGKNRVQVAVYLTAPFMLPAD